ncbi:hypothetical protein [Marinobacter sp.]|uniref:hypothetical protein n=1 Tax=Marinobacter sp. TaxID=50741 RepID=UPI000C949B05|nr:hypothetical protein [Marinobacter sp.]MAB50915.1 hypothetical protein [Marinobacter sp.]|tara:strand:+ start:605 stop:1120 length:516 start_codon:yes stop_codon:yes gene_type:complete
MRKYNDNDVVVISWWKNNYLKNKSVEEVIRNMWEVSGDDLYWKVEDEVKKWNKSFEGGKKYVVRGKVGSRGYYEGLEVIREGEDLFEKDLLFGSDFWKMRLLMIEDLKEDLEDGSYSKEKYEELVKLYKEGSNKEVFEESLCGCINYEDGCEFNEEESYYYYVVDKLKEEE